MPGKIAKSGPRPAFGLPEALAAVHTSRLSCGKAGKTRIYTPIRASFGESQLNFYNDDHSIIGGSTLTSNITGGCYGNHSARSRAA